jgi:hypothetical protein
MSAKPETVLSRAIQDALIRMGAMVERVQSGVVRGARGTHIHLARKGTPDLWAAYRGGSGWLEVKCGSGKRTPEQIEWAKTALRHGIEVHEVRSVAEAVEVVRSWERAA